MKTHRSMMKITAAALWLFLLVSCYSYEQVRLSNPVYIGPAADRDTAQPLLSPSADRKGKKLILSKRKMFCRMLSWSPLAKINNHAVDLALEGRLPEAEILFRDVIKEDARQAAALNNLGIIYETAGDLPAAFDMYSRACVLDPANAVFRRNFMTFIEARHDVIIGEMQ